MFFISEVLVTCKIRKGNGILNKNHLLKAVFRLIDYHKARTMPIIKGLEHALKKQPRKVIASF
jgi:hypothetical protein